MTFAFPVVVHQLTSVFFSILFRIPFPHRSSHPGSPKDQTQAGGRGQETDISLREENSIKERQSTVSVSLSLSLQYVISLPGYSDATVLQLLSAVSNVRILFQLVQGRGAAGVLSPKLHLTERRPHYYSGQRHQRRHVHLHR